MKVLSLFSGIGAFEKALEKLEIEYELVNYCEFDKYASKSYAAVHNEDESKNLGDITKVDEKKLPKDIDLITYGFPCQDISLAGKQKGFEDEEGNKTRSGLFYEALRIIEETKPKIAIAENVKNLVSKKFKNEFTTVLSSLEEAGYNNYWQVLNAKNYGIPQNRDRVFIVSIRKDIDTGCFKFPEPFDLKLKLKDMLDNEVDEKYYLSKKMTKYISATGTKNFKNPDCRINLDVARPLTTDQGKRAGTTNYISDDLPNNYDLNVEESTSTISMIEDINNIKSARLTKNYIQWDNSGKGYNSQAARAYYLDGLSPTLSHCNSNGDKSQVVECDKTELCLNIKEKTKRGYKEAYEGDGVYINRPHQKRGVVQHGMIQTLKTSPDVGVVVNDNVENNNNNNNNNLILAGNMSGGKWDKVYESARRVYDENGISPTIPTCQGGNTEPKVLTNEPQVLGGIGEKKSNGGKQFYQQDRIYDGDKTAIATTTTAQPYYTDKQLRIRKLTPTECWRLMGFKDEDINKCIDIGISNAQLYKQAGNSIVVDVLVYLFKEILKVVDMGVEEMKKVEEVKTIIFECDDLIDLAALKESEPDLYKELVKDYPCENATYVYKNSKDAA